MVRDEFVFFDTSDSLKTTNPSAVVVPLALKSFPSNTKTSELLFVEGVAVASRTLCQTALSKSLALYMNSSISAWSASDREDWVGILEFSS